MSEPTTYTVKLGFWLRAYESFEITASSKEQAIEEAKSLAKEMMESSAIPEHIDHDERRQGVIVYIDELTPDGRRLMPIAEDVEFDDDRINAS